MAKRTTAPFFDKEIQLSRLIEEEMVRLLYLQANRGFLSSALLYFPVAFLMIFVEETSEAYGWLAYMVTVTMIRFMMVYRYANSPLSSRKRARYWGDLFVGGALLMGLGWGGGFWVFTQSGNPLIQSLILFLAAGLTAGSMQVLSFVVRSYVVFTIPVLFPIFIRFFLNGGVVNYTMASFTILFGLFCFVTLKHYNRTIRMALRLGIEKADLVDTLTSAKNQAEGLNTELLQEIRRREEMESELRLARDHSDEANRAKSDFLATVSHELRTPMNGMFGMFQVLHETTLDPSQRNYLDTARKSAESLDAILSTIIEYTRIDTGRVKLNERAFRLTDQLRNIIIPFRDEAHEKGLKFDIHISLDTPTEVVGDVEKFSMVLRNLLSNALKFTKEGEIVLNVSPVSSKGEYLQVLFVIEDTGIGIAPQIQKMLFQPFRQGDSSLRRVYGGAGLGLAISQKLIILMGGKISLESIVDRGTKFSLVMPFRRESSEHDEKKGLDKRLVSKDDGDLKPLKLGSRILVVEDDAISRRVAKLFLERMGMKVGFAENGEEALRETANKDWDLILMDCHMPIMDGMEACRQIRQIEKTSGKPRMPIVALTANIRQEVQEACTESGMDGFIAKPIRKNILQECLQTWLSEE